VITELSTVTAAEHLRHRGLISEEAAVATELAGGVSCVVIAVEQHGRSIVVKQSLERLRVADAWFAPRERTLTEGAALATAHRLTPESVPRLLDIDEENLIVAMERAPTGWLDWKTVILGGDVHPEVGARLGRVLGDWHRATLGSTVSGPDAVSAAQAFEQLRIDPFHRTVVARAPELAHPILEVVDRMSATRVCLVHGDFSPKNVLVAADGSGAWVIDFEVAHTGDPSFDLAFMVCHLALKSVHRPELRADLTDAIRGFVAGHVETSGRLVDPQDAYLASQVACLLLARVRGKSPAGYLTPAERETVWTLGRDLLLQPEGGIGAVVAGIRGV
jgi:aminoglycoside phosphotransferase (APT) family kinase protein